MTTPAAAPSGILTHSHWNPHIQTRDDLFREMQQLLCRMETTRQIFLVYARELDTEITRIDKEYKAHQAATTYRREMGLACESARITAYKYWTYLATRTVYARLKQTFGRFVGEVADAGTEWTAYSAHPQNTAEERNTIVSVLMKYETAADIITAGVEDCWMPDAGWLTNYASIETVARYLSEYVLAVKDACNTYLQTDKGENSTAS